MSDLKSTNLIIEKLYSTNTAEVIFAINKIRNSGKTEVLPHIIELLNICKDSEINKAIIELLYDLKIQAGAVDIINALKNEKYSEIHKTLLISCWQSGLNYSDYIEFFVDLFIQSNFEKAFEAFTIIENIESEINIGILEQLIKKLKLTISDKKNEKSDLTFELIHVLENMKE